MTNKSPIVNKLSFHDQRPGRNHFSFRLPRLVRDDEEEVLIVALGHPFVSLGPFFFADVADHGQHAKDIEEACVVIGALERSAVVTLWEGGEDGRGDQVRGEERGGRRGG